MIGSNSFFFVNFSVFRLNDILLYFLLDCTLVAILWSFSTAVVWDTSVSAFSPATNIEQYHTNLRMTLTNMQRSCQGLNYSAIKMWHQDLALAVR